MSTPSDQQSVCGMLLGERETAIEGNTNQPPSTERKQVNNSKLLSRNQAAEMLGIGVTTLWRLTKSGRLPVIKIGSRCLYTYDDILQFAEHCRHFDGSAQMAIIPSGAE